MFSFSSLPSIVMLATWMGLLLHPEEQSARMAMVGTALLSAVFLQQSYTYFTWRNTKAELTAYSTELAGEMGEYYRPNFFANTPDINPVFLQTSGRPGFIIRSTLAATLSVINPALVPGMAIVFSVDKFMSEVRALTNITGNGIATVFVSWWEGELDHDKLKKTVAVAMRMLDNVIDINYYAVKKARDSNLRHRPVGLGIMGFQDALYQLRVPYASQEAVEFADRSMEAICYHAYWASTELAEERGRYSSYRGSLWDRGILPLDSVKLLLEQRGGYVDVDTTATLNWDALRARIAQFGMRNSNCVAIAPTATISNIIGVDASIEPCFGNLSVKSNLSGEFTVVNEYLVRDLKKLGLWDDVMVMDLKHFDGSLRRIDRVPEDLKALYATAFEVEPVWLVEAASRRQKWIDQAQSLNIYMAGASGKRLDETYKLAWIRGLKTTYYLRTVGATHAEKSTVSRGQLNAVSNMAGSVGGGMGVASAAPVEASPAAVEAAAVPATDIKFCSIDNPDCEACQ